MFLTINAEANICADYLDLEVRLNKIVQFNSMVEAATFDIKYVKSSYEVEKVLNDLHNLADEDKVILFDFMASRKIYRITISNHFAANFSSLNLPAAYRNDSSIVRDGRLMTAIKIEMALSQIINVSSIEVNPTKISIHFNGPDLVAFFESNSKYINSLIKTLNVSVLFLTNESPSLNVFTDTNYDTLEGSTHLHLQIKNLRFAKLRYSAAHFFGVNFSDYFPIDINSLAKQLRTDGGYQDSNISVSLYK